MSVNQPNLFTGEEMQHLVSANTPEIQIDIYNEQSIMDMRMNTCTKCEFITSERMCSVCGCPAVMMSQFNFKTCPKGYWK
jgi:hypothetical protein